MSRPGIAAAVAALIALCMMAALPGSAAAAGSASVTKRPGLTEARTPGIQPRGYDVNAGQARRIADRLPAVQEARRENPRSWAQVLSDRRSRWVVSYYPRHSGDLHRKRIAEVILDGRNGRVLETWTGFRAYYELARGYPGYLAGWFYALPVWLPLLLLFVAPFIDRRRPLSIANLDVLVLAAFSVSVAFFTAGRIEASVPLVYPLLLYLLGRMLWIGLGRSSAAGRVRLHAPIRWLEWAIPALLLVRLVLNLTIGTSDIGHGSIVGADRLADGDAVYGNFPANNPHGDTYGPVMYLAYVPFEQFAPWGGASSSLAGAHFAAMAFDVACVALLFLLGRRLRGRRLGVLLAFGWLAYPFTAFTLAISGNDALVAALLLLSLLSIASPPARGAMLALAGFAKLAPLALVPLFAFHGRRVTARSLAAFIGAFVAVGAAASALVVDDISTFIERTIVFQAERPSPFSLWGLHPELKPLQAVLQVAVVALGLALAFVPRRRDVVGTAALAAAVLIAVQLTMTHWFYIYIVWFFPLVLIALLARQEQEPRPVVVTALEPPAAVDETTPGPLAPQGRSHVRTDTPVGVTR